MHHNNLLISIVIPSYNQGDFIARTIESILIQDYNNYEIIVIDGGSTDNTIEVLEKYINKINIFISEKDNGQSDAINKGIQLSKGELVGWINSDDTFAEGSFGNIISHFNSDLELGFIYGNVNLIDEEDNIIGNICGEKLDIPSILWKIDLLVPQQGAFWKRDKLIKYNINLNIEYHFVLDRDIFIRTLMDIKSLYINRTLGNFRHQNNSKSISMSFKWIDEIPILYETLIVTYASILNNKNIHNIRSMVKLYLAVEYFKFKNYSLSTSLILKILSTNPLIFFKSGFIRKIINYFTKKCLFEK